MHFTTNKCCCAKSQITSYWWRVWSPHSSCTILHTWEWRYEWHGLWRIAVWLTWWRGSKWMIWFALEKAGEYSIWGMACALNEARHKWRMLEQGSSTLEDHRLLRLPLDLVEQGSSVEQAAVPFWRMFLFCVGKSWASSPLVLGFLICLRLYI